MGQPVDGVGAMKRYLTGAAPLVFALIATTSLVRTRGIEVPGYEAAENWARLPSGIELTGVVSAAADADGNVYAFRRADPPIVKLDRNGGFVHSLAEKMFVSAHGLHIDRKGMLWATDVQGHVVYELDPDGHALLTLGTKGVSGEGPDTFNGPTDVLVTSAGDIFVTDGQFNSRVVHFTPAGKFVKAWGTKGTEPGQFKIPHALAIDSKGRLFVADRDNQRIELFDQDGRFLEQWTQFGSPSGIFISADDTLYVAAIGSKSGLIVASARDGQIRDFVPIPTKGVNGPHMITADSRGTVYVADLLASTLRKFTLK
jgi:sugar lactone lactonase YvrE